MWSEGGYSVIRGAHRRRRSIAALTAGSIAVVAASGFAVYRLVGSGGTDGPPTGIGTTSASASSSTSASSASSASSAPPASQSPPADHPTPATTGVRPGTSLKKLSANDQDG